MTEPLSLSEKEGLSRSLAAGVAGSFLAQGWLALAAFAAAPYIVSKLKAELYGVYSLSGLVAGYFYFFELGLSAAAIKYAAQELGRKDERAAGETFWSCAVLLAFAALAAVSAIIIFSGPIISGLLNIPPELEKTARRALWLGAAGLAVTLYGGLSAGMLRALGEFTSLNKISAATGTLQVLAAVSLLACGRSVLSVLAAGVFFQALGVLWQLKTCREKFPALARARPARQAMKRLLKYGGVLSISSALGPVLGNVEKLFLTRFSSVAALTYYAVPFSLIDRLSLIPAAFSSVLFPSYSYYNEKDRGVVKSLHFRGTLYITLLYLLFAAFFAALGGRFLDVWMGREFAAKAAGVLAVLALGGLLNAAARPAINVLQGMGKPHIPVIFHAAETALYIPLAYFLVKHHGILGAAWAWTIRVAVDAALLHAAAFIFLGGAVGDFRRAALACAPVLGALAVFYGVRISGLALTHPAALAAVAAASAGYCAAIWKLGLDDTARKSIAALAARRL